MKLVDLHTHSCVTDGSHTPCQLVRLAKEIGISALALTDHDNVYGYYEAQEEAEKVDIELMTGIEMSVNFKGEKIHILGLGFDIHDCTFKAAYQKFRKMKESGMDALLKGLQARDILIDREMLGVFQSGGEVDRYAVFRYFSARKVQDDVQYIWDDYLNPILKGININVEAAEAIAFIKNAGGITSLAHFHKTLGLKRYSRQEQEDCIRELQQLGLSALETQYSDYTETEQNFIQRMAEKYHMLQTGGTDFHGENRPKVQLGTGIKNSVAVPYAWYEKILERCKQK